MKSKFSRLLLTAVTTFCLIAPAVHGQTTNAPSPTSFLDQVKNYFTSFNTNLTWTNTPIDGWTGMNYQDQVNTSAEVGGSYDLWHISAPTAISAEAVLRNSGVAGTVVSYQGGFGANLFHYDTKVTGYLDGGQNLPLSSLYVEFGARFKKKLTANSYTGISLGFDHFFAKGVKNQNSPTIGVLVGFDF